MHADSGRVLYRHDERNRMLIASVTKIMTALVVLEHCELSESVEILPEYAAVEGSSMYLKAGETLTVEELLYGMLLASGNDAATALACHTGGSEQGFAELMNEKARELSLGDTSFANPHGLDSQLQYSSAYDLAVLTEYAMRSPDFSRIVSTKNYVCGDRSIINHNKLLWSCQGVSGVKTGYTQAAGRTLVSFCERDGLRLICVTLNDRNDWQDHSALYDWAFAAYEYRAVESEELTFKIPLIAGEHDSLTVRPDEAASVLLERGCEPELKVELPRFVYSGVRKGERAGRVVFSSNGEELGDSPLVFTEGSERREDGRGFFDYFFRRISGILK